MAIRSPERACARARVQPQSAPKIVVAPANEVASTGPDGGAIERLLRDVEQAAPVPRLSLYVEDDPQETAVNPLPVMPPLLTTDGVHRDRPNVPAERAALVAYLQKL